MCCRELINLLNIYICGTGIRCSLKVLEVHSSLLYHGHNKLCNQGWALQERVFSLPAFHHRYGLLYVQVSGATSMKDPAIGSPRPTALAKAAISKF